MDLPKSKNGGKIGRDEWMARSIASVFDSNPNAKMLVVVGNNHALKKLDWLDHIVSNHGSIRQFFLKYRGEFKIFSFGQVIGESIDDSDFLESFSDYEGAVALYLDEMYKGWKLAIT